MAVADEQARQAIETEKLLNKMKIEMEAEKLALDNKRIHALIDARVDPDIVKRIINS